MFYKLRRGILNRRGGRENDLDETNEFVRNMHRC
jgi:hypothetical protein